MASNVVAGLGAGTGAALVIFIARITFDPLFAKTKSVENELNQVNYLIFYRFLAKKGSNDFRFEF